MVYIEYNLSYLSPFRKIAFADEWFKSKIIVKKKLIIIYLLMFWKFQINCFLYLSYEILKGLTKDVHNQNL